MAKHCIPVLLAMLSFSLLCLPAFADILPLNTHYVERCVKITNLDQYPSIVVITQDLSMSGDTQELSIAKPGECLPAPSYKFDDYKIYWADRNYVDSINLQDLKIRNASYGASSIDDSNIHFITSSISTAGGYVDNSNPAASEEVTYVIEADSAGGYSLAEPGMAVVKNGTENNGTTPSPAKPSTPSKPAPTPLAPPPGADGASVILYMLLVLVLGAAAIFILVKSMQAHQKSMPPPGREPMQPESEEPAGPSSGPSRSAPPSSGPRSKPAARKKKG